VRGFDAVLFDLDGTLVDSRADIALCVNFTLAALGRPALAADHVERYVGEGVRQLLEKAAGPLDEPAMARALGVFLPYYLEHCADTTRPYPGAEDLLRTLAPRPLGLITNKPAAHTQKTLATLGWEPLFKAVLGGDSLPTRKPAPEPLWAALEIMGVKPERALMVGDSPVDVEAGRAAGVPTVGVWHGFRSREELAAAGPDYLAPDMKGLKELLRL
jgi:phosphoglycolate phosphatase